jgi:hypothetical protein
VIDYVVFLAIPMAAADPLLDPLRIPGEIVIHHERAELEIDALVSASVAIMIWPSCLK